MILCAVRYGVVGLDVRVVLRFCYVKTLLEQIHQGLHLVDALAASVERDHERNVGSFQRQLDVLVIDANEDQLDVVVLMRLLDGGFSIDTSHGAVDQFFLAGFGINRHAVVEGHHAEIAVRAGAGKEVDRLDDLRVQLDVRAHSLQLEEGDQVIAAPLEAEVGRALETHAADQVLLTHLLDGIVQDAGTLGLVTVKECVDVRADLDVLNIAGGNTLDRLADSRVTIRHNGFAHSTAFAGTERPSQRIALGKISALVQIEQDVLRHRFVLRVSYPPADRVSVLVHVCGPRQHDLGQILVGLVYREICLGLRHLRLEFRDLSVSLFRAGFEVVPLQVLDLFSVIRGFFRRGRRQKRS